MLYVERAENGRIIALHGSAGPRASEQKAILDEELIEFINQNSSEDSYKLLLSLSDAGVIRILEDLIDLLIRKNIIHFTELPQQAQERIMTRSRAREKMASLNFIVDDIL